MATHMDHVRKSMGVLPADPAPALKIGQWLQKGMYDEGSSVGNPASRITVLVCWADWCPLSRAVLPKYDRVQADLKQGTRH